MKTLITISSEQVWPQIIPVYQIRPDRVIILHTGNKYKSEAPAQRLKEFFALKGLVPVENIKLHLIAENEYPNVLDAYKDDEEVIVNLTGGKKIMTIMLSKWVVNNNKKAFYFDDSSKIYWVSLADSKVESEAVSKDVISELNNIDPIEIAELYLGKEGISDRGRAYKNYNECLEYLRRKNGDGKNLVETKYGEALEREIIYLLLEEGIKFRHSVILKPRRIGNLSDAEIDVLVNYNATLILIECKLCRNRNLYASMESRIKNVYDGKEPRNKEAFGSLIQTITKYISENKFMQYKADLVSIRKIAGLTGKVFWITTNDDRDDSLVAFCEDNNIKHATVSLSTNGYIEKKDGKNIIKTIKDINGID